MVWFGLVWFGLVWFGLVWFGVGWLARIGEFLGVPPDSTVGWMNWSVPGVLPGISWVSPDSQT